MDEPDDDEHNDDYYEEWPEENNWGHDAMLDWDATAGGDDDASSVNTREAGLSDDDAESDWGRDAYLAWDNEVDDANIVGHDNSDDDAFSTASRDLRDDATEESEAALVARGMPDYRTWALKDLQVCRENDYVSSSPLMYQKLCKSYGYRPITKYTALVGLAIQCWRAIHPTPTCGRSKPVPVPSSAPSRSSSISSADMPLAAIQQSRKAGKQSQTRVQSKSKAKQAVSAQNVVPLSPPPAHVLSSRFFRMIRDDEALYLRILRYEVSHLSRLMHVNYARMLTKPSRSVSMSWLAKPLRLVSTTEAGDLS
jgi:hypothetical protein